MVEKWQSSELTSLFCAASFDCYLPTQHPQLEVLLQLTVLLGESLQGRGRGLS